MTKVSFWHLPLTWCIFCFFYIYCREITPNFCLRWSNAHLGSGLVKMSAIYSLISTYSSFTTFCDTWSLKKVIFYRDVLCLGVHNKVFLYVYGTGIVTIYHYWVLILHKKVFQCLVYPNDLSATWCSSNVFGFYCGEWNGE